MDAALHLGDSFIWLQIWLHIDFHTIHELMCGTRSCTSTFSSTGGIAVAQTFAAKEMSAAADECLQDAKESLQNSANR